MNFFEKYSLFVVSFASLNVFSFVIGMIYATLNSWYWRSQRTMIIQIILYFMALAGWYSFDAYIERTKQGNTVTVDCRLAEISPDFTTKLKEQCRELNRKQQSQGTK